MRVSSSSTYLLDCALHGIFFSSSLLFQDNQSFIFKYIFKTVIISSTNMLMQKLRPFNFVIYQNFPIRSQIFSQHMPKAQINCVSSMAHSPDFLCFYVILLELGRCVPSSNIDISLCRRCIDDFITPQCNLS